MIRADRNAEINEILRNEYYSFTVPFLTEWSAAFDKEVPPFRINEFGIIDEKRYDTDKGVLVALQMKSKKFANKMQKAI